MKKIKAESTRRIISTVQKHYGIHVLPETVNTWKDLYLDPNKIKPESTFLHLADLKSKLTQNLISLATTNKTYFFRMPMQLLENTIENLINNLIAQSSKKPVFSIWSAGCSTGEEAYSIAILLMMKEWHIKVRSNILGTDINQQCLSIAQKGEYSWIWAEEGREENVSDRELTKYFEINKDSYKLIPAITNAVRFRCLNILKPEDYNNIGPRDLIIANNVFNHMFFDRAEGKQAVFSKLQSVLYQGGRVISNSDLTGKYFEQVDEENSYKVFKRAA
ncbi:CheR family methyltransferase [Candidatus Margulisiibacteriota bacterium]